MSEEITLAEALATIAKIVDRARNTVAGEAWKKGIWGGFLAPSCREVAANLGVPDRIIEALYPIPPKTCHECGRPMEKKPCSQS